NHERAALQGIKHTEQLVAGAAKKKLKHRKFWLPGEMGFLRWPYGRPQWIGLPPAFCTWGSAGGLVCYKP
ncbi:MAG: hypothetical protein ACO38Q_06585, partial [Aquiluna sp.]